jgi:hypothetical protein
VDASLKAIKSHIKRGAENLVKTISAAAESQLEVTVHLQNRGAWSTAPAQIRIFCGLPESLLKRPGQAVKQGRSHRGTRLIADLH